MSQPHFPGGPILLSQSVWAVDIMSFRYDNRQVDANILWLVDFAQRASWWFTIPLLAHDPAAR